MSSHSRRSKRKHRSFYKNINSIKKAQPSQSNPIPHTKVPTNTASLGVRISMPLREHRSQPSFHSHLSFSDSFPGSVPDDGIQGVFPTFQQHAYSFVPKHQRNDLCVQHAHIKAIL